MGDEDKKILEQQLWNIADTLRGKMSPDEFRNYILGFIFYKYLSEKMESYADELLKVDGINYQSIDESSSSGEELLEALREEAIEKLGYFLNPSELFSVIAKRGSNTTNNFILEDLTQILRNIEHSTMGYESEDDFGDLFEDLDLTSTKLGRTVDAQNTLITKVLTHLDKINFDLQNMDSDILGDAYEYLIAQFAAGAGKKAGEFYTPQQVSKILAKIVTDGKSKLKSVYDPTCGSGSLLLRVAKEVDDVSNFYGQEQNRTTYNLARMNMIMHDVHYRKFNIQQEDTLENPQHIDEKFEAVVANPPFSAGWSANPLHMNDDRFSQYGKLAPKSRADFAFVQHMIYQLDENGTMAIVLPHGVLFRGYAEGHIREYLIKDKNYLDAVIGLPENMFYGTEKPFCILVFKKCRDDNQNVLFIDASQDFEESESKNVISNEQITEILDLYESRRVISRRSYLASLDEIKRNNYYLNISRYITDIKSQKKLSINNISEKISKLTIEDNLLNNEINQYCQELGISSLFEDGLINKIFNQEVRFKNNNGKNYSGWKEVKLKDILHEHKTKNDKNQYNEVFSVAKKQGVINQIKHLGRSYASENLTKYKVVYPFDIVYTKSPTKDFPFGIIKSNKTNRTGVVSTLYAVFTPENQNISLLIDYYFLSWVNTYNYLYPIVNKGVKNTMNINNDIFLNGPSNLLIKLPSDLEEQEKLVNFLKTIDKKIQLIDSNNSLFVDYRNSILQEVF
jgi:type I restriction enzyme M protein